MKITLLFGHSKVWVGLSQTISSQLFGGYLPAHFLEDKGRSKGLKSGIILDKQFIICKAITATAERGILSLLSGALFYWIAAAVIALLIFLFLKVLFVLPRFLTLTGVNKGDGSLFSLL